MRPSPKALATAALIIGSTATGLAQTIFTFGGKPVSKEEFLKAYNKNNTAEQPTDKSYRDYLELYTRFKLKVQAAYDQRLDTLPAQLAELTGFRNQVVDNYMNDDASVNILINEAAERLKKDISVAHIFVAADEHASPEAIARAEEKIKNIQQRLQNGEDFAQLALQVSEDPAVKNNKGAIGYITALVLPYAMENAIYATAPGKTSAIVRSQIGFHIFKNLAERPAIGKVTVAQILLGYPPDASDQQKAASRRKADSLIIVLNNGADFKELALMYSTDNTTYQSGGEIMEFGVGRYAPAFEQAAFALKKDGEISAPFETDYGVHIIKRIKRSPLPGDLNDKIFQESLRTQVLQSDRMNVAKNILYDKIRKEVLFKQHASAPMPQVIAYGDSLLQNKNPKGGAYFKENPVLFQVKDKAYRFSDWKEFLQSMLRLENMRHLPASQLFETFCERTTFDYYRDHLENYNPEFAYQLHEFKEGNLLFEIMQRKIWDVASTDSVGLHSYYEANKDKYWWEASADAVIFTAINAAAAEDARKKLEANPKEWKSISENSNGNLQADSGRFELGQIPVFERTNFTDGLITANVKNEADNTITFAYILKVYRDKSPRNFADARGFIVNDYQLMLEEKWINELKKKYPVRIKEKIVKSLPKQ
ncbi:peptidylprolyl isomerase [Pseudoflavitalea rhizosphaerae]|uniref:peptidylprolyl isomerase n=1 Tax=Pseudoflavitalea rhizosphaerae TaxID=1884793 RepID=UPI000F8E484B|nr:peptidylprolyl isomerase [Pseudoflavitalea rhizosphaerae]